MKYLAALFVTLALAAGSVYAGCGMKDTDSGKLTSYDKEAKAIVVETKDGSTKTLTLTPATESKDAMGEAAKIENTRRLIPWSQRRSPD
jgi:hypothetical protein